MLFRNVVKQILNKPSFEAAIRSSSFRRNAIHGYPLLPATLHSRKVDTIFKIETSFLFKKLMESLILYKKLIHIRNFLWKLISIQEEDTLV